LTQSQRIEWGALEHPIISRPPHANTTLLRLFRKTLGAPDHARFDLSPKWAIWHRISALSLRFRSRALNPRQRFRILLLNRSHRISRPNHRLGNLNHAAPSSSLFTAVKSGGDGSSPGTGADRGGFFAGYGHQPPNNGFERLKNTCK
jgi:hypothetical protein